MLVRMRENSEQIIEKMENRKNYYKYAKYVRFVKKNENIPQKRYSCAI